MEIEEQQYVVLSSLNIEKYDEWSNNKVFIEDVMRFLDNVMEDFIIRAPDTWKVQDILQ